MTLRSIIFLLLFISAFAHAQSTPKKQALAEKLVRLMHFDQINDDALKDCSKVDSSILDAADAYRRHPETFADLSPKSAHWREVEQIYSHYRTKTCASMTNDDVVRYFAREFAQRASEEDLRAYLAFNSSPTGQRLLSMQVDVNKSFQIYANQLLRKAVEDAELQYQREIADVLRKFHADHQ